MNSLPVSLDDVRAAARRIEKYAITTPLLEAPPLLQKRLPFRLFLKAENLQRTGAFKARGAFNQILQLSEEEKRRGVIALSTGNHAQAVAYAASVFGIKAVIVMPKDAPALKINNTRKYGAEVVALDRTADREATGRQIAEERGLRMIHPYNDPRTIAGQGTAGIEILQQSEAMGFAPDVLIVNCSGGGLAAGIAVTRDAYKKPPMLYTAEPAAYDDTLRSLEAGHAVKLENPAPTICDAVTALTPGSIPLPILLHHKAKGLAAADDDVKAAMSVAAEHFKLVLEPAGALSLACACLNSGILRGKNVVIVASGGNADPDGYTDMVRWGNANQERLFSEMEDGKHKTAAG